jgi:2-polyprenyl-3-methyl-5-hydroxy-6-metoxy-1,4-benzoquinol methylase
MAADQDVTTTLKCLACGSTDTEPWTTTWDAEYLTTSDRFSLHRCRSCGVLFIDPVPSDRLSEIYPSNYYSFVASKDSMVHRVKSWLDGRLFKKILAKLPGDSLSVLDVGGGQGWQLNIVRDIDPRVKFTQVVDFDPGAQDLARENGHEYFCGRIEDFETDRKFDLVLLLNLIEHVEDPLAILKKIRSILSPKGVVLVKTPNHEALDARVFRHKNWGGFHSPRHWVIFTKESFQKIASTAGLKIREFSYTQGAPFWTTSILFGLAEKGRISVTKERPATFHPLYPLLSALFAGFDFVRAPFAKLSQMFIVLGRDDS